jgi:acyl-CoA reductase-like NAD-dependent aldehyde dehydrogenase
MTSPQFPEPPAPIPPTPTERLDAMVDRLAERKDAWIQVGIPQRIAYLQKAIDGVLAVAEGWVKDGCRAKGIAEGDELAGEEWLSGPWQTIRNARLLVNALEHLGQPKPPKVYARPDGQLVARVFPATMHDRMLFGGFTGEVWLEPGRPASQGRIYREASPQGKVALVLGAGNVSSIGPMDAMYKLFAENEVVILKMNPVNAHVGPHLEVALKALIDDGFLAICYGGAQVGAHLSEHPKVDTLHVTGSDRTYDAIVWGGGTREEQEARKRAGTKVNPRPFSAELGCVTPVIVVPGPWSAADLDFQAQQVAGMVAHNASFNCNAAKVLVVAKGWLQREAFLRKVHEALAAAPPRKAYYPGAEDRYKAFLDRYPQAKALGASGGGIVPWTIIPDVPAKKGEYALTSEAFCGVLAEVALDATDAPEFLAKVVPFANDECWGTLSCTMLVHPTTEHEHAAELDRAIANLRYGGIGINCWAASVYALVSTTWGAFPGHPPEDIQSGTGVVHNAFLLDHPQKSVVRAPFRIRPKPAWFTGHKSLARMGKKLTTLEAAPSWGKLAGVAVTAFKG